MTVILKTNARGFESAGFIQHGLIKRTGMALAAAGMSLMVGVGSATAAASVSFTAPDNLEVGAAPLPATSTFGMGWDFEGTGAQSLVLYTSVQAPYQLYNSIVPSTNGHAINTKGAGANDRVMGFGFTPATSTFKVREARSRVKMQNNMRGFVELDIDMSDVSSNPLYNDLLLLNIEITSPAGMVFARDITVEIFSDFSGMVINTHLVAPASGIVDPILPDATFQLSAVAVPVPEPTASSLLLLASASLLKRRRD